MPTGRKAFIGTQKETVFGTPVAATQYTRFRSEGIITEIEEVTPPNIQNVFDEGPTYGGLVTHGGPIAIDAHPNWLGWLLLSAIGVPVSTVNEASVRWTHVFDVRQTQFSEESLQTPLTLEIQRDLGNSFQYAGSVVNTLGLAFGTGAKVLGATAGIIAKSMARITPTTPTFDSLVPFLWRHAAITLPDPTAITTLTDVAVNIDNGLEGKEYIDGSTDIARIRPAEGRSRVITVSGTMIATNAEATEFTSQSQRDLRIVFTGPTLGTANYKLTLKFPRFLYRSYPIAVAGPGELMVAFSGKAKYDPAVADTPMEATLINSRSAY